jgi:hypothetical protein
MNGAPGGLNAEAEKRISPLRRSQKSRTASVEMTIFFGQISFGYLERLAACM